MPPMSIYNLLIKNNLEMLLEIILKILAKKLNYLVYIPVVLLEQKLLLKILGDYHNTDWVLVI
jgi:hypothetical protein